MRVGIRVDASPQMGTGHLRRCMSLAQALAAQDDDVHFVTRPLGIDSAAIITTQGFEHIALLDPPERIEPTVDLAVPHASWAQVRQDRDSADTVNALRAFGPDWVVVDSYSFDARWHRTVREALGCRIAQVDDVADRRFAPDLLIDHNHAGDHARKYAGCLPDGTMILGGPLYALIGPRFATAPRYVFRPEVRSVGIFMGGVDAGGHSQTVLGALRSAGFAGPVEIVTTSANPQLGALRRLAGDDPVLQLSVDLPDLAEFFARHDIQVGAGGGASWERCCIGVPTLLVIVAENQRAVAPRLAEEGVVALADAPEHGVLAQALEELLQNPDKRGELARRARELVDGYGAARVAEEMKCFA